MKYEEACTCGATMTLETESPTELARSKSQWAIDHGPHGDNTITIENKRLMLEYREMEAKVKKIENQAYPAMVVGYDMIIANKIKGEVLYRATISPGNGFHWEDPNSPITLNLQPKTMKLPDVEDMSLLEAEAKESLAAQSQSSLSITVDATGEKPPPAESVLAGISQKAQLTADQIRESILGKIEVDDEQGKQTQGKRDKGAKASKGIATRSRIRSDDVGRRRNPRQG